MKIIKHGDPERTDRLRRYTCRECGCEFIAGLHEAYRGLGGVEYTCYCPDCHALCAEEKAQ